MTKTHALDRKKYAQLLTEILPSPITSDSQHREWLGTTDRLMREENLSAEGAALLKLLSILISEYERTRHAEMFQRTTPAEALSYLMEENRLSQRDFPGIPQSRVSEIVAGKRKISKAQARILGERFRVSPALFLD